MTKKEEKREKKIVNGLSFLKLPENADHEAIKAIQTLQRVEGLEVDEGYSAGLALRTQTALLKDGVLLQQRANKIAMEKLSFERECEEKYEKRLKKSSGQAKENQMAEAIESLLAGGKESKKAMKSLNKSGYEILWGEDPTGERKGKFPYVVPRSEAKEAAVGLSRHLTWGNVAKALAVAGLVIAAVGLGFYIYKKSKSASADDLSDIGAEEMDFSPENVHVM